MSSLAYVGPAATGPADLVGRSVLTNLLNTATPNRTSVTSSAIDYAGTLADKVFVDTQDALYQLPDYFLDQDLLNLALTTKGQALGAVGLDNTGTIPVNQLPVLGTGYLLGPFGPKHIDNSPATYAGSTGSTPMKLCDWEIGAQSVATFRPLVFMTLLVSTSAGAQPVIEVRISDGPAAFASQTRVAQGQGRSNFLDRQSITVLPAPATTGQSGLTTPPTYTSPYLTAWLWDANSQSVTFTGDGLVSASLYLLRSAQ